MVANVDARVHNDPGEWPSLLSAQLCSPVRWRQTLETLAGLGATSLVELGPGGVLSGLARRVVPELQPCRCPSPTDLDTLMDRWPKPESWRAEPTTHQGEHLYMSERVVVSPGAGIFAPEESLAAPGTGLLPGTAGHRAGGPEDDAVSVLGVGDLVGRVGGPRSARPSPGRWSAGWPTAGERVQEGQPLVWLRVPGDGR